MSTEQIHDQIEDSAVALCDADFVAAGIRELHEALLAGRLDSLTVTDVAKDALPRLDAIRAWLQEQIVEVTL